MASALDKLKDVTQWTLLQDMLNVSSDVLDKREGSVLYDAIASVAVANGDLLTGLIPTLYQAFQLLYAKGEDLDAWAANFGLTRRGSLPTYYHYVDTWSEESPNDTLLVGDVLRSHNSNVRWIITSVEEKVVKSETDGNFQETTGGVLEPERYLPALESVVFGTLYEAGREVESDESLRERILRAQKVTVGGSLLEYVDLVLNVYAEEGNQSFYGVQVYPLSRCCGRVFVVPYHQHFRQEQAGRVRCATEEERTALAQWLDPRDERGFGMGHIPIGHHVDVVGANARPIDFHFRLELEQGKEYTPALGEAICAATDAYLEKVGDEGLFTRTTRGKIEGGRYWYTYSPFDHLVALNGVKKDHPELVNVGIGYYNYLLKRMIFDIAYTMTEASSVFHANEIPWMYSRGTSTMFVHKGQGFVEVGVIE